MPPRKINLVEAADRKIVKVFDPHVAGDVNDSQAKVAKFGEVFDWHAHENEDEAEAHAGLARGPFLRKYMYR